MNAYCIILYVPVAILNLNFAAEGVRRHINITHLPGGEPAREEKSKLLHSHANGIEDRTEYPAAPRHTAIYAYAYA